MRISRFCLGFFFIFVTIFFGISSSHTFPSVLFTSKLNSESSVVLGFTSYTPIMIANNDDFSLQGFTGQGTSENPFLLENVNITSDTPCIRIYNTTAYFVVRNSMIQGETNSDDVGIYFYNVSNGMIEACTIRMRSPGLHFEESSFCEVQNCTVDETSTNGITISNSNNCTIARCSLDGPGSNGIWLFRADGCNTTLNNITDFYHGIYVESSHWFTISNCTIHSGGGNGIWVYAIADCSIVDNEIYHFTKGIFVAGGYFIYIDRNLIYSVSEEGILIRGDQFVIARSNIIHHCSTGISIIGDTAYHLITNNTIFSNEGFGIYDGPGPYSVDYYYNLLGWNSVNAKDVQETIYFHNQWDDDISHGNFWSDYNGTGTYSVPGTDFIQVDNYPRKLTDSNIPLLGSPDDMIFELGTAGNDITWHVSDDFPLHYRLIINGSDITYDWLGGHISENFDNTDVGIWNVTIQVVDCAQNNSTDTVWVTVLPNTPPTINGPSILEYEVDQIGNWVSWSCADVSPASYRILRNNSLIDSGVWDGSNISINVDSLSVGVYNYTLILEDVQGNTSSHFVILTVIDKRSGQDSLGLLIPAIIVLFSATSVALLIMYSWRKMDTR